MNWMSFVLMSSKRWLIVVKMWWSNEFSSWTISVNKIVEIKLINLNHRSNIPRPLSTKTAQTNRNTTIAHFISSIRTELLTQMYSFWIAPNLCASIQICVFYATVFLKFCAPFLQNAKKWTFNEVKWSRCGVKGMEFMMSTMENLTK